jgi:hypothetical protein
MSIRASGRFDIDAWDEQAYDEREGAKLARTHVSKTFHGGIEGTSTAELLMAYAQEGAAAYVGIERVEGSVNGQHGTFVLAHKAVGSAAGGALEISVVPNSGTGSLRGLSGTLNLTIEGDGARNYTLEYDLSV